MRRIAPILVILFACVAAGCGGSEQAAEDPPEPEPTNAPEPTTTAPEQTPPSPESCTEDTDCAPNHSCFPTECVLRSRAVIPVGCEETGPPLPGPCVCVEGACVVGE